MAAGTLDGAISWAIGAEGRSADMKRWFWLVVFLALSGFFAVRVVDALALPGEPDKWAHVLLPSIGLAFALVALVACWLGRRMPLLFSPNPFINSLAWIVLIGGQLILVDLVYYRNVPPFAWVGPFALAYVVSVIVQQILSTRNGPPSTEVRDGSTHGS